MADRIVVIGGGYAGLACIGEVRHLSNHEIVLVDPGDSHELIPELPEALREHDPIEEHVVEFDEIFSGTSIRHLKDGAVGINSKERIVRLASGETMPYDWLVLSPGTVTSYPPIPGLQDLALPLRNAHDTRVIKSKLSYVAHQRIVIVGGGLTGTEVAGILAPDHDVWLIEGMKRLLPGLGSGLATYARKQLSEAGVQVLLGQKLVRVEGHTLKLERDEIQYDVLIWAGGIRAPQWLKETDLPLDTHGYPVVSPEGRVSERVFAAGDVWRVKNGHQEIPQTAQLASLAGHYVGEALTRAIRGEKLPDPFKPRIRGMLISLDPGRGVGWVIRGGIPVRGSSARTLKALSFQQYRLKLSRAFGKGWPF